MPMYLKQLLICLTAFTLISAARPPSAPIPGKSSPSPTGHLTLTFTERSPFSAIGELVRRTDLNLHETDPMLVDYTASELEHIEISWRYDLAKQPFDVVVPSACTAANPHGLFVWIGPTEVPTPWLEPLARQKLILVSAAGAADRVSVVRESLALDAVHNMKKLYKLDPNRIYIAGFSSGAQLAAWLVRAYPDVFSGGYFLMGGWFYESIDGVTGWFGTGFQREYVRYPSSDTLDPQWKGPLEKIKKNIKLVLLRGENDEAFHGSLKDDHIQVDGLLLDGFVRSTCIQVPGLAHQPPDATWFEKGLTALEFDPKPAPTTAPTKNPDPHPDQIAQAKRILMTGEHNGTKTRRYAEKVLKDYPTTPAAEDARKVLDWETRDDKKPRKR